MSEQHYEPVDETHETTESGIGEGPSGDPGDYPGAYDAGITDTTATGAGPVDDPSNSYVTGTLDTAGAQGGTHTEHEYYMGAVESTLSTLEAGSPSHHADPVYRAPSVGVPGSVKDTSLTDLPISDGLPVDQTRLYMTEQLDTVNFVSEPMDSDLIPAQVSGTPVAVGGARGALVSWTPVADPVGAPIQAYRIEIMQGDPNTEANHWPGTDWAGRNETSLFVTNLNPDLGDIYDDDGTSIPGGYRFRVAAVNGNGTGPYSEWSNKVQAYNPDQNAVREPEGLYAEHRINPIYSPDGSVKAGTGGTTGPVQTLTAAPTANAGELDVDWADPAWGTPDGHVVRASSGEEVTVGDVNTALLTGLASGVAVTVTVTPTNEVGSGVPATSAPATPL